MTNNTVITITQLEGLTCSACQKITEKRLKAINGVQEVVVKLENGEVKITGDRAINTSEIIKALEGTDYKVK